MGTTSLDLPAIAFVQMAEVKVRTPRSRQAEAKDFSDGKDSVSDMQLSKMSNVHYGGEVGVFYGQFSGKYGGDAMGSYIQGTVGNDKFELTAGGSYQEWNLKQSRGRH